MKIVRQLVCNNVIGYRSYYVCDVNLTLIYGVIRITFATRIDRMNKSDRFVFLFDIIRIFFENSIFS